MSQELNGYHSKYRNKNGDLISEIQVIPHTIFYLHVYPMLIPIFERVPYKKSKNGKFAINNYSDGSRIQDLIKNILTKEDFRIRAP